MLGDSKFGILVPSAIALAMLSFHFWVVATGAPEVFHFRGTHLIFALVLIFLWYPVMATGSLVRRTTGAAIDCGFILLSCAVVGYLFLEHDIS